MKKLKFFKFILPATCILSASISLPFIVASCAEEQDNPPQNNNQNLNQELEKKRNENDNILKNLKWTYNSQEQHGLYNVVNNICTYKNQSMDAKTGLNTLGIYPVIQVTNSNDAANGSTYLPITEWFTPITTSVLKGKIFSLESIKTNFTPSTGDTNETYSVIVTGLTVSDVTADYPNGDWRTMAKSVQPVEIMKIIGPTQNNIKNVLTKYKNIADKTTSNNHLLKNVVNEFLKKIVQVTQSGPTSSQAQTTRAVSDATTKTPLKGLDTLFENGLELLTGTNIDKITTEIDKTNQSLSLFEIVAKTLTSLFGKDSILVNNSKEMYNQIAAIKSTKYPTSNSKTTSTFSSIQLPKSGVNIDDLISSLPENMKIQWFADMIWQLLALSIDDFYIPFYTDMFNAIKPSLNN